MLLKKCLENVHRIWCPGRHPKDTIERLEAGKQRASATKTTLICRITCIDRLDLHRRILHSPLPTDSYVSQHIDYIAYYLRPSRQSIRQLAGLLYQPDH